MTEPTYEFIRGQGWVVAPPDCIATRSCGTRVKIEFRPPRRGERYVSADFSFTNLVQDGKPVIENWIISLKRTDFKGTAIACGDDEEYIAMLSNTVFAVVTPYNSISP